jgi:LmbE family N-acetylglucosaminyl deacetylase
MRILYIFPHPDDESFGPAPAISYQQRQGHEIHLLTLTRGEATKQRHRLGVSKEEMGEIRYNEMKAVAEVLDLDDLTVWDFPDDNLKELDPRSLEKAIHDHIKEIAPDILVTYAVHGISGFFDHLVTHAVVKRLYCDLRDQNLAYAPRRLALFTLSDDNVDGKFNLKSSHPDDIDVALNVEGIDMERFHKALDCYETYQQVIEDSGVRKQVTSTVYFELFDENFNPYLSDITEHIPDQ